MAVIEGQEADKRLFERIPVAVSLRGTDVLSGVAFQGYTHDVSGRGIGLIADRELLPGMPLELVINVPDGGPPLDLRGRVLWSQRIEASQCRAGILLNAVNLMEMSRILRVYASLE